MRQRTVAWCVRIEAGGRDLRSAPGPPGVARLYRGVGKIAEDAVDAHREELLVRPGRVAGVGRCQAARLVAEGPGVHRQAALDVPGRVPGLGIDADLAAQRLAALLRCRASASSKVGIRYWPLQAWLRSAKACFARKVLISARVQALAWKPLSSTPSTGMVLVRPANSGRSATSVLATGLRSWRAISTPSRVDTRSGSMRSAPCSMARRWASSVCAGRWPLAPRCPMTSGLPSTAPGAGSSSPPRRRTA